MNILFGMPVIHSTGGFHGEIKFCGHPVFFDSPRQALESGIGMVHQEFMLIPGFSVAENIKLNREPLKDSFLTRFWPMMKLDWPKIATDARYPLTWLALESTRCSQLQDCLLATCSLSKLPVRLIKKVSNSLSSMNLLLCSQKPNQSRLCRQKENSSRRSIRHIHLPQARRGTFNMR